MQTAVLEAIDKVKKQQNELYLQRDTVTNLITEANQIKDEIIRLRNDCQNEVNLLQNVIADQGATQSMQTLTQRVYSSIKEHVNMAINNGHDAFANDIVVLRSTVGDLKKDIKRGQSTLDEATKELLGRLEDTDNAIGVLDGNIKDIGKEITEVDAWTVEHLRNIKTKLKDLKSDVEDIKQARPDPPTQSPILQLYRLYNPPNI